jgi:hypothetical protein
MVLPQGEIARWEHKATSSTYRSSCEKVDFVLGFKNQAGVSIWLSSWTSESTCYSTLGSRCDGLLDIFYSQIESISSNAVSRM